MEIPVRPRPHMIDRLYSADEVEFLLAMQSYQQRAGRKFPTWCEALGVLVSLGYERGEHGEGEG